MLTLHRQENVDVLHRLNGIFVGLKILLKRYRLPIVFPIHPRTRKMVHKLGLITDEFILVEPLDYLSFLQLEANARLILTDSGGVQEEACILKIPCVTLRDNTERPETLEVKSNYLAGTDAKKIVEGVKEMLNGYNKWHNPFGNGNSAEKIIDIICDNI